MFFMKIGKKIVLNIRDGACKGVHAIIKSVRNPLSVPSWIYAVLYFASIPSFALLYNYTLRDHFYHSSVVHEESIIKDKEKLSEALSKAITHAYKNYVLPKKDNSSDWELTDNAVGVTDFRVSAGQERSLSPEDGISFIVFTNIRSKQTDKQELLESKWHMVLSNKLEFEPIIDGQHFCLKKITIKESGTFLGDEVNSAFLLDNYFDIPDHYYLYIPKELNEDILKFVYAIKGYPAFLKDNLFRMLYFSAVTITTLGFGDIVPISNSARLAVTVESLLGVILIGLFLSSLAAEIKRGDLSSKRSQSAGRRSLE